MFNKVVRNIAAKVSSDSEFQKVRNLVILQTPTICCIEANKSNFWHGLKRAKGEARCL